MTPLPISQAAEDALVSYLGDPTYGLTPVMAQLAPLYLVAPQIPYIDWNPSSRQVYRVWMSVDDFIGNGAEIFPAVMIHVNTTLDQHTIKGRDFSGSVMIVADFILSTNTTGIPTDLQQQANLLNDAVYRVFGSDRYAALQSAGITLNGGIQCARQIPRTVGDNFTQLISFGFPMRIDVN
jgi:hypothetical protein